MGAQRHIIKRQILELQVAGETDARRLQTEFARIYRRRIVPLLDRYCTALSDPHCIHRIQSLELDLGPVDPEHLEAEIVAKVSAGLKPLLRSHIEGQERQQGDSETHQERSGIAGLHGIEGLQRRGGRSQKGLQQESGRPRSGKSSQSSTQSSALSRGTDLTTTSRLELLTLFARAGHLPWWADGARPELLEETLEHLLRDAPDRLRALLRKLAREPRPFRRIVNHYADNQLSALLGLLAPRLIPTLPALSRQIPQQIIAFLQETGRASGQPEIQTRRGVWYQTLRLAGLPSLQPPDLLSFLRDLLMQVAADFRIDHPALIAHMNQWLQTDKVNADSRMRAALETLHSETEDTHPRGRETGEVLRLRQAETCQTETKESPPDLRFSDDDQLYIDNAGLAILWPFLGHFFRHLGLMQQDRFKDQEAMQRAVGLLQYLATEDPAPPEYLLPLNKLLCGMEPEEIFAFDPPVLDTEAEECANLLQAAIAQAPILKDMSIPAFRSTFLLRQGILSTRDGAWLLRVERKTFDVVLDRFPWNTDWVKLPWMQTALRVEW